MKMRLWAAAILLLWGLAKAPWEKSMEAEQTRLMGRSGEITMEMRNQLGQNLTLAALGGFRGLAAVSTWLMLQSAWEKADWSWVRSYVELGVMLQPRDVFYWDNGAWQLAYNASIEVQNYGKNMDQAQRAAESRRWVDEGIKILQRGIAQNPQKAVLYQRLGELYERRLNDYREAARYYELATQCPDCPPYLLRFPGYMLLKAGDDRGAYDYWARVWPKLSAQEKASPQWGRVREEIKKLEEKLKLPRHDSLL